MRSKRTASPARASTVEDLTWFSVIAMSYVVSICIRFPSSLSFLTWKIPSRWISTIRMAQIWWGYYRDRFIYIIFVLFFYIFTNCMTSAWFTIKNLNFCDWPSRFPNWFLFTDINKLWGKTITNNKNHFNVVFHSIHREPSCSINLNY